jgi:type IV pilus assembly protein PilQ
LDIVISPKDSILTNKSAAEEINKPKSNPEKIKTISLKSINISKNDHDKISIETSAKLTNYSTYTLNNPNRIIINLNETRNTLKNNLIFNRGEIVNKIKVGATPNNLSVTVELKGNTFPLYQVSQQQQTLNITFENKSISSAPENTAQNELNSKDDDTETSNYTGEKISLDFKDADIKNILRLIADISGQNMIISDNAKGKITLKLEDIPWDEALDIILETNRLGKIVTNTVTRIETNDQIKRINEEKLMAQKSEENLAELVIKSYEISYAKAADLAKFITKMGVLSDRGSVNSFDLTNKLSVQEIEENIHRIEQLINEQDIPTRQVLIEAKIVQSNPTYLKQLGVQWTAAYNTTSNGDIITGLGGVKLGGVDQGLVNFGYLSDSLDLDVTLTALENEGELKILSSPKVLGLDNMEARIKQGVALPYLELSEEGVTSTEFKDMVLELKVTPKITPAGTISIHVFVTKNQPSAQTGFGGEPGIDIREVETDLLIESGKTIVIGGIYETEEQKITEKVPFFGDIPYLRKFFTFELTRETLVEMLVFLTVTIVEQPTRLES